MLTELQSVTLSFSLLHTQQNRGFLGRGEAAPSLRFFDALAFAGTDPNVSDLAGCDLSWTCSGHDLAQTSFLTMRKGNPSSLLHCFVCDGGTPLQYAFLEAR